MRFQSKDHFFFAAVVHFLLHFFQREMHYVVVMQFLPGAQGIAETQPQPVQQANFIRGKIGRVRPQNFVRLVAVG